MFFFYYCFFSLLFLFFFGFFFFNDTATTEIYTLSLHDALPISGHRVRRQRRVLHHARQRGGQRSEEHTSELQSRQYLVCRLLLEKTKKKLNGNVSIKKKKTKTQHNKKQTS